MTAGVPVGMPIPELDSYVKKGEALKAYKREADPEMRFPWDASPLKDRGR